MKKAKTLETKLRSAIRLIWSRSAERKSIIKTEMAGAKEKVCPDCQRLWPVWAFDVDHEPPIGELASWKDTVEFIQKMFWGPQRLLCKTCHKKKTAAQRRKR